MNRPVSRITGGVESFSRNAFGIFTVLLVFGIAMGILESAVVIYLRELFYPGGFGFPMAQIPPGIVTVELWREGSTLVMLVAVAVLAGRTLFDRFMYFLFAFGVWDIAYYLGLKAFTGWPPSLFSWDVLFLIPVTWVAPVIAPVLCSIIMISMSLVLVTLRENGYDPRTGFVEAALLAGGAFLVFLSYIWDSSAMLIASTFAGNGVAFQEAVRNYVPQSFRWGVFLPGVALIIAFIVLSVRNSKRLI